MSRFKSLSELAPPTGRYGLLPFKFHVLNDRREILVSEAADFLLCPRGTAERVATKEVSPEEPLFNDLLGGNFITLTSPPPLFEVLAERYRARKGHLDDFTSLHIIVITLRCNFSCHYCQVSRQTENRKQYDMCPEHLAATLDLIFQSPSPAITIEFQGGEPLAAFDLIKVAVESAVERNQTAKKLLRFVICSNLSLLTDDILHFCKEHDIYLSTSLDGPEELHKMNRPAKSLGSLTWLRSQIDRARSVVGSDHVAALMTTSKAALGQPEAIIDAYMQLEFRRVFLRPIQPYGFAERLRNGSRYSVEEFLSFYKRALSYILEINRSGRPFVEEYAGILMRRIFSTYSGKYVDLLSPTGMVTAVAVYNYDGGVYASDEARMIAESGDKSFRLGDVLDDYSDLFLGQRARTIVETGVTEALAGCADCGLQSYCGSDLIRNWRESGDMYGHRPTSAFCELNMGILTFLLELIDEDPESAAILKSWAVS